MKKKKEAAWIDDVSCSTPDGYERFLNTINTTTKKLLTPPPKIPLSQWCNENRIVASGPWTGPYRWQRVPYQKEMLDVIGDLDVSRVVLMLAIQTGKTMVMESVVAYYMLNDPSPIMIVMPSEDTAETWSETKLEPMIDAMPELQAILPQGNESGNQRLRKKFPSGEIRMVSAGSEKQLRGVTIRIMLMDEIDVFPEQAGTSGDPVELARGRTSVYWDAKEVLSSTPTVKGFSRIWDEYQNSDQRHYYIPCPQCKQYQEFKWLNIHYENDDPSTASFKCGFTKESIKNKNWLVENRYYYKEGMTTKAVRKQLVPCGKISPESRKNWMITNGVWVKHNPDHTDPGFHLSSMLSPMLRSGWQTLVKDWLRIERNDFKRMQFINERLAEPWEHKTDRYYAHQLKARREDYDADVYKRFQGGKKFIRPGCPTGVGVVTAGIDVQKDWIELGVHGWGIQDECWLMDTQVFKGETSENEVWMKLHSFMHDIWYPNVNGAQIGVWSWAIDSGDGHTTDRVYQFVQMMQREGIGLKCIKGANKLNSPLLPSTPTPITTYGIDLWMIGVNQAKEHLVPRLAHEPPGGQSLHLRKLTEDEILEQLTSEMRRRERNKKTGQLTYRWVKTRDRNEQLDCWVYSYAAMRLLSKNVVFDMPKLVETITKAQAPSENQGVPESSMLQSIDTGRFS